MAQIRYNWGICTNRDMDGNGTPCPKCASKERIRIIAGHDFVCPECGERLSKVQAPKTPMQKLKPLIIAIIAVVVIGAIVAVVSLSGGGDKKEATPATTDTTAVKTDSTAPTSANPSSASDLNNSSQAANAKQEGTAKEAGKAKQDVNTKKEKKSDTSTTTGRASGSKNLGYAIFKGTLKGGKPDDVNGRLIFKSSHVIDSRDPKGRVAEAGDYVIGEFSEGHLVQGIWYGADNVVKGSIIIGK